MLFISLLWSFLAFYPAPRLCPNRKKAGGEAVEVGRCTLLLSGILASQVLVNLAALNYNFCIASLMKSFPLNQFFASGGKSIGVSPVASVLTMNRSDQSLSRVQLFAAPWTAALQASLSIANSRSSLKLMDSQNYVQSLLDLIGFCLS